MAHATFRERLPRTNAPIQPRNGEKKMEVVVMKEMYIKKTKSIQERKNKQPINTVIK